MPSEAGSGTPPPPPPEFGFQICAEVDRDIIQVSIAGKASLRQETGAGRENVRVVITRQRRCHAGRRA